MKKNWAVGDKVILNASGLDALIQRLTAGGFDVIGPALRDGAIVYDRVQSVADFPAGWTEEQAAGAYRVKKRHDNALFGYAVGPQSWKKFLHPAALRLWKAWRKEGGFELELEKENAAEALPKRFAFIGVRACELSAMAIQDKVFLSRSRREDLFLVAVQCGQAGGTCFCVSMNTGPKADSGFDIALTEILEEDAHRFVAEAGSARGAQVLDAIALREASAAELATAEGIVRETAGHMGRSLDTEGIKDLLAANADHSRWDDVASRCLSCANCTMVCPTCFCTTMEDVTDLTGEHAERWRKWDSCFTMDFSYLHGGSVRASAKSRYRQWLTHKLSSWMDQFGTSGCVGCGRCITWCPVGIDITQEVGAIKGGK